MVPAGVGFIPLVGAGVGMVVVWVVGALFALVPLCPLVSLVAVYPVDLSVGTVDDFALLAVLFAVYLRVAVGPLFFVAFDAVVAVVARRLRLVPLRERPKH